MLFYCTLGKYIFSLSLRTLLRPVHTKQLCLQPLSIPACLAPSTHLVLLPPSHKTPLYLITDYWAKTVCLYYIFPYQSMKKSIKTEHNYPNNLEPSYKMTS